MSCKSAIPLSSEPKSESFLGQGWSQKKRKKGPIFNSAEAELVESKQPNPKIINLSKRDLSIKEIAVLERGLKFTPTPRADSVDLKKDTEEFCRKLRLRLFFQSETYKD
jgi:hypothetical protein